MVHTDVETIRKFVSTQSPEGKRKTLRKAYRNSIKKTRSKSKSQSSSGLSSLSRSPYRSKVLRESYYSPIKIIKMKVDNTYDYKLPPFYMEAFCQYMLESDEGMRKLHELHKNYPLKRKLAYNVVDYVNSTDYVVRSMELGLGMQNEGVDKSQFLGLLEAAEKVKKSREGNLTERSHERDDSSVLKGDVRKSIEIEDEIESDDVFANNPSNLMLAKIKIKKKEIPKTDA
jgi:hypothetical protein